MRSNASRRFSTTRFADLVLGPGQDGKKIVPEGLKASAMNAGQQAMLLDRDRRVGGHPERKLPPPPAWPR